MKFLVPTTMTTMANKIIVIVTMVVSSLSSVHAQQDAPFCCASTDTNCPLCDTSCSTCYTKQQACSVYGPSAYLCGDNNEDCCFGSDQVPLLTGCSNIGVPFGPGVVFLIDGERCPAPPPPPPVVVTPGGGGDPHFKTWSGDFYDYQGECDLVLVSAPEFCGGKGLRIHIRTTARYDYSFIESAAILIGDMDILEVSGFGQYALNGIANADLQTVTKMADRYTITHTQDSNREHTFVLQDDNDINGGEQIVVATFKDWVSVKIVNGSKASFDSSVGLMGEYGTGDVLGRNGTSITDDLAAAAATLAPEWQVLETEPMLFQMSRAPQYPQTCFLPTETTTTTNRRRRRLGETSIIAKADAEAACIGHWKNDARKQKMCVHDVMASGDLDVARANSF